MKTGTENDLRVANNVTEKLARDELVVSMTVRLVPGIEIVMLAKTSGYDTIYVDLQHSSFSLATTSQICIAALQAGIAPFVRVPSHDGEQIARILDGGALGIIAPDVRSPAQAKEIVRACKYPPHGKRSVSGMLPHIQFRKATNDAVGRAMNAATSVIVMIESKEALDQAEEIAKVDGVDMLFIGANDLSGDLDIPGQLDHPLIDDAYLKTIAACRKHGKHLGVGGLAARTDLIAKYVTAGARYVSMGMDSAFLLQAATEKAKLAHAIALKPRG